MIPSEPGSLWLEGSLSQKEQSGLFWISKAESSSIFCFDAVTHSSQIFVDEPVINFLAVWLSFEHKLHFNFVDVKIGVSQLLI